MKETYTEVLMCEFVVPNVIVRRKEFVDFLRKNNTIEICSTAFSVEHGGTTTYRAKGELAIATMRSALSAMGCKKEVKS